MNFKEALETAAHSQKHYIKRSNWGNVWVEVPTHEPFILIKDNETYCPDMDSLFANDWIVIN